MEEKFDCLKYSHHIVFQAVEDSCHLTTKNNFNFVRPNPGIGSNFLEELRKLRFLWSKLLLRTSLELESSSTFKTRIGLGLTHPSLPVPRFYDPIYQTLWLWMLFKIDISAKLYLTLWLFENPLFSMLFKIDFYAKLY